MSSTDSPAGGAGAAAGAAGRPIYYTRADVAKHNGRKDCWVVIHGAVIDFSALVPGAPADLVDPVLAYAGQDLSHWFTKGSDGLPELKTFVHPVTNRLEPYTPEGRFLHVPASSPSTAPEDVLVPEPWWRDPQFLVGRLTGRPRTFNIVNTLTSQTHVVEFSAEETVAQMQDKYAAYNAHCRSYTWKAMLPAGSTVQLDPAKTMAENGVPDETEELERIGLDPLDPANVISILLFFNDDLTVA